MQWNMNISETPKDPYSPFHDGSNKAASLRRHLFIHRILTRFLFLRINLNSEYFPPLVSSFSISIALLCVRWGLPFITLIITGQLSFVTGWLSSGDCSGCVWMEAACLRGETWHRPCAGCDVTGTRRISQEEAGRRAAVRGPADLCSPPVPGAVPGGSRSGTSAVQLKVTAPFLGSRPSCLPATRHRTLRGAGRTPGLSPIAAAGSGLTGTGRPSSCGLLGPLCPTPRLPWRSREAIAQAHCALPRLGAAGLRVPRPWARTGGRSRLCQGVRERQGAQRGVRAASVTPRELKGD